MKKQVWKKQAGGPPALPLGTHDEVKVGISSIAAKDFDGGVREMLDELNNNRRRKEGNEWDGAPSSSFAVQAVSQVRTDWVSGWIHCLLRCSYQFGGVMNITEPASLEWDIQLRTPKSIRPSRVLPPSRPCFTVRFFYSVRRQRRLYPTQTYCSSLV